MLYKVKRNNIKPNKWETLKKQGYKGLMMEVPTKFKSVEDNKFHAIFSTAKEDRHGEIVYQNWDLKSFKKNPVYLDSHNYSSIDFIIGKVSKVKVDKALVGDIEFALSNPRGELAYNLAKDGFLNTSSVGFIPKKFDDKGNILEAELLEISAVGVPANPEATYQKKYENNKTKQEEVKDTEGSGEPADDSDGQGEGDDNAECEDCKEEARLDIEEGANEEKSINPEDKLKIAIQKEIEIKERAINKILTAISLVKEASKGRCESNASINNKINVAVKKLLDIKLNR